MSLSRDSGISICIFMLNCRQKKRAYVDNSYLGDSFCYSHVSFKPNKNLQAIIVHPFVTVIFRSTLVGALLIKHQVYKISTIYE